LSQNHQFFGENIFKIITSVPGHAGSINSNSNSNAFRLSDLFVSAGSLVFCVVVVAVARVLVVCALGRGRRRQRSGVVRRVLVELELGIVRRFSSELSKQEEFPFPVRFFKTLAMKAFKMWLLK
jgi:hypothetical protein